MYDCITMICKWGFYLACIMGLAPMVLGYALSSIMDVYKKITK